VRASFADDDTAVMSPQSLRGSIPTIGSVDGGNLRYTSIFDPRSRPTNGDGSTPVM
jgi:hypothetical protein